MIETRPMPADITIKDRMRFWKFFDEGEPDECWPWKGTTNQDGRGHFRLGGETYIAPRVAYYFEHRKDPGSLYVCHTCDNPLCVNPRHLILDTQGENIQAKYDRGRDSRKGTRNQRAKLTESDVLEIRRRYRSGERSISLAEHFDIHQGTVNAIVSRRTWAHL